MSFVILKYYSPLEKRRRSRRNKCGKTFAQSGTLALLDKKRDLLIVFTDRMDGWGWMGWDGWCMCGLIFIVFFGCIDKLFINLYPYSEMISKIVWV